LISKPNNRASVLARFDGTENIGKIVGTILSPIILTYMGRYGNYGFKAGFTLLSIIYIIMFVKETPKEKESLNSAKENCNFGKMIKTFVIHPLRDMVKTLFKIRPKKLHILIAVQFYMFGSYWFILEEKALKYLYMLKTFEGNYNLIIK
jgi:MFS family permease